MSMVIGQEIAYVLLIEGSVTFVQDSDTEQETAQMLFVDGADHHADIEAAAEAGVGAAAAAAAAAGVHVAAKFLDLLPHLESVMSQEVLLLVEARKIMILLEKNQNHHHEKEVEVEVLPEAEVHLRNGHDLALLHHNRNHRYLLAHVPRLKMIEVISCYCSNFLSPFRFE